MKIFKNTLLILTLAITLASCDKEEDEVEKTRTEILTDGEWQGVDFKGYDSDGNLSGTSDISNTKFNFNKDGTGIYTDGVLFFDWNLTSNETIINFQWKGGNYDFDEDGIVDNIFFIITLNDSELIYSDSDEKRGIFSYKR